MTLQSTDLDMQFMQRALELACRGRAMVAPNPMVGCVVVNNESIIAEGWHERVGQAHAEVNAINSVIDSKSLEGATVYVTLEPCSHYGKTPPCANLLAGLPIRRVVVATLDPNPVVSGKGIKILKEAGKIVDVGLLGDEAIRLNQRFFVFHQQSRPYIILKWAQTEDGYMARENHDSKWISNEYSRVLVHKWRTQESAIAVGSNTIKYDDPRLSARNWSGPNPTRIIVNPSGSLKEDYHIFDGEAKSLIYTLNKEQVYKSHEFIKLAEGDFLSLMMMDLWEKDIQSLFVEGGAMLLKSLLQADLWDEAKVFVGTGKFNQGLLAPTMDSQLQKKETLMEDVLLTYLK